MKSGASLVRITLPRGAFVDLSHFTFSHNQFRDDIGNVVARRQAAQEGPESQVGDLAPFQMLYEDGVERLGAGSPRERVRWVAAIWSVIYVFIQFVSHPRIGTRLIEPRLFPLGLHLQLLRSAQFLLSIVRFLHLALDRALALLAPSSFQPTKKFPILAAPFPVSPDLPSAQHLALPPSILDLGAVNGIRRIQASSNQPGLATICLRAMSLARWRPVSIPVHEVSMIPAISPRILEGSRLLPAEAQA